MNFLVSLAKKFFSFLFKRKKKITLGPANDKSLVPIFNLLVKQEHLFNIEKRKNAHHRLLRERENIKLILGEIIEESNYTAQKVRDDKETLAIKIFAENPNLEKQLLFITEKYFNKKEELSFILKQIDIDYLKISVLSEIFYILSPHLYYPINSRTLLVLEILLPGIILEGREKTDLLQLKQLIMDKHRSWPKYAPLVERKMEELYLFFLQSKKISWPKDFREFKFIYVENFSNQIYQAALQLEKKVLF